ncbi:MAG: futalosine hydrolase [Nitrospirae bacterium]|nr:futalosine hydrolase [Nitrospirota bacterium]
MKIVILYAVAVEGQLINETSFLGHNVFSYETGMGKVNAAHICTLAIERHCPDLVISIGICGAYPGTDIQIGDVAIAEREVYGDEGVVLKDGFHGLEKIGIALFKDADMEFFNVFEFDRRLIDNVFKGLSASGMFRYTKGTFLTLSTCTGTLERALQLKEMFDPICENMEGAAIAHVCAISHTPLLEIRGVSNIVEDRDMSKWNIEQAVENCQQSVILLINSMR